MVLLKARGVQAEDFAKLHPAGTLGRRLLTSVSDIMRTGEKLAVVSPDDAVANALDAMTRARAGAVVVVNSDGRLGGRPACTCAGCVCTTPSNARGTHAVTARPHLSRNTRNPPSSCAAHIASRGYRDTM
ncbi:MAG: hypothetical protein CMO80_16555 [Verrucomicrobiales bacterium]|nr:hypothetical protein [Verrucomicrobiales bacterium]